MLNDFQAGVTLTSLNRDCFYFRYQFLFPYQCRKKKKYANYFLTITRMNPGENKPADLQFEDNIFHLDLHPSNDIVATGMINGRIQW